MYHQKYTRSSRKPFHRLVIKWIGISAQAFPLKYVDTFFLRVFRLSVDSVFLRTKVSL